MIPPGRCGAWSTGAMDDGTYESAPARRALNPLEATGQTLVVAAILMVIAGVFYAWAFERAGWRQQLEILSSYGASIVTAIIVLGGMLALIASRSDRVERVQVFYVAAQIVAGLVILLAIAASISTLTQAETGFDGTNEWPSKLAEILPRIGALLIGGLVLLLANTSADE